MKYTSVYTKLCEAVSDNNVKIIVSEGGARSSKTYSAIQVFHNLASSYTSPNTFSIVSETLPHLKKGAIKDYIDILLTDNIYSERTHNKSSNSFSVGKSTIEYFSADQPDKVRGPARDYLFVNECNNIKWETFDQLLIRTSKKVIIDFNPVSEFWAHEYLRKRNDVAWINSTFRDNEYIPEGVLREILRRKDDPNYVNWWRVYGDGLLGQAEGVVYPAWNQCDKIPDGATLIGYGLDFGYTNDPSALVAIYKHAGEHYVDELIYQTGLLSADFIRIMKQLNVSRAKPIYADSADPRLIKEISLGGFNIKGVKKEGLDESIDFTKKYFKYVTKSSTNTIKELRNYVWLTKDGKSLNIPIDSFNHGCDAFRYAFMGSYGRAGVYMF